MKTYFLSLSIASFGGFLLFSPEASAQNLVVNGDFENGTKGWSLFAPAEAKQAGCTFDVTGDAPHDGGQAAKLTSEAEARYGIVNYVRGISYVGGDRYRVSVWVKAGDDFQVKSGMPGFLVRISFFTNAGTFKDSAAGHFYLALGGHAAMGSGFGGSTYEDVPKAWTKLEGVFEMPSDAASMNVSLFVQNGSGSIYFDDVSLESVEKTVPLSVEGSSK